jgi:glycosyltransferase involved in cell wall biosynthesis
VKVVLVSKAHVRGVYQRGLEELAGLGGLDLTVITPPSWREGRSTIKLERRFTRGYQMIVTPIIFNGRYHVHFYPRLGGLLDRIRPDLVHVDEEPYNFATYLALREAKRAGARRLFYTWQNIYRSIPLPFSLVERANYTFADAALAANEDAADVLRRKGFQRRIAVIPPGLDPELYVPVRIIRSESFRIGYIGRLVAEKGVDLLIRACHRLAGNWTLQIVGEGDQIGSLHKLAAQLEIQDRIQFRPAVASSDVPTVLRELDVLVLPSRSRPNWREQFGRVLMEAMACAVPVVGSTCGEIPRVIEAGGFVFPEDDVEALSAHLLALQADPELRRELGLRGRERVLSNYTHRRVAESTLAVYRSLVVPST